MFHSRSLPSHVHKTTPHSHSFSPFTFVSFLLGPCFSPHATRACTYSTSRTTRIIHCTTVSVYPGTFTLPANRRQLCPFPSPRSFPSSKVTPFYRRGPRVTCWISLPRLLPTTISLSHMIPLILQFPSFTFSFPLSLPCSCVRLLPKSQSCRVSISSSHCSSMFACLYSRET